MRRPFRLLAGLVLVPTALLTAPAAEAASPVQITYVHYDSKGSDTGSNTSLNDEYVTLRNLSTSSRSLTGWTLRDRTGYTYRFPTLTLKPGAAVVVRTGKGTASSSTRYYNRSWYVWNNTGDTAYLKNASGTTVDTCSWSSLGKGARTC